MQQFYMQSAGKKVWFQHYVFLASKVTSQNDAFAEDGKPSGHISKLPLCDCCVKSRHNLLEAINETSLQVMATNRNNHLRTRKTPALKQPLSFVES